MVTTQAAGSVIIRTDCSYKVIHFPVDFLSRCVNFPQRLGWEKQLFLMVIFSTIFIAMQHTK